MSYDRIVAATPLFLKLLVAKFPRETKLGRGFH